MRIATMVKWNVALILLSIVGCETILQVNLKLPEYVKLNRNATLKCEYNVPFNHVHKVEWLKSDRKIFRYVKGRNPPFHNHTIPGGKINWEKTNGSQLSLYHLGFSASGVYSCSVTTETPIYTRMSEEKRLQVVQIQTQNPVMSHIKKKYVVGDQLEVNCTSGSARPVPELTWLINGNEVSEYFIKSFPEQSSYASTIQIAFQIKKEHNSGFTLTCLSTIPRFMGKHVQEAKYADHRSNSVKIDISKSNIFSRTDGRLISYNVFILLFNIFIQQL